MSLADTDNRWPFLGNDVATSFAFDALVPLASDLVVTKTSAAGVDTVLTLGVHYSVTGAGVSGGGYVTYPLSGSPLATGERLTLVRTIPLTQPMDLTNGGGFFPDQLEAAFDRATMQVQQLNETQQRALVQAITSIATYSKNLPDPSAGYMLGWNSAGNALENKAALDASLITVSAYMATLLDEASAATLLTELGFSSYFQTLINQTTLSGLMTEMGYSAAVRAALLAADNAAFLTSLGVTAFAQTILDDTDAFTVRQTIDAPIIPKLLGGLEITRTAARVVLFNSGVAANQSATGYLRLAASMSKDLNVVWAAGDTNGGRGDASLTASTWYHCFVVNTSGGAIDCGFDTSISAANLLNRTGGTWFHMVGSVRVDASSNIREYVQEESYFRWVTPILDTAADVSTPGTSRVTLELTEGVPLGLKVPADIRYLTFHASTAHAVVIGSIDETDAAPSITVSPLADSIAATSVENAGRLRVTTNVAREIYARSTQATTVIKALVVGYEHPRGRW